MPAVRFTGLEESGEVIVDRLAHASEIARFTAMWCAGPRCRTRHLGQVPSVPMARAGFISGQSSVNGDAGFGLWGDDVDQNGKVSSRPRKSLNDASWPSMVSLFCFLASSRVMLPS